MSCLQGGFKGKKPSANTDWLNSDLGQEIELLRELHEASILNMTISSPKFTMWCKMSLQCNWRQA